MATRMIVTSQPDIACELCGRRLLRGEQPDVFLASGRRRTVCELCAPRARAEGWLRETDQDPHAVALSPARPRRRRSLLDRWRQAREPVQAASEAAFPTTGGAATRGAAAGGAATRGAGDAYDFFDGAPVAEPPSPPGFAQTARPVPAAPYSGAAPAPVEGARAEGARAEGARVEGARSEGAWAEGARVEGARSEGAWAEGARVEGARVEEEWVEGTRVEEAWVEGARAEGARADGARARGARAEGAPVEEAQTGEALRVGASQVSRALEVFNAGEHPRRVAGVARSLGAPIVTVHPPGDASGTVTIVICWELSWYRYEVDLADEAAVASVVAQGTEPSELAAEDRAANATAQADGTLALIGSAV